MADVSPFFLTGSNAFVKVDGKVVAYATNISGQITVNHASPRVLGRAEVEVNQPLSYDVSGSISIIKYAQGIRSFIGDGQSPASVSNDGNGPGTLSLNSGFFGGALGAGQFAAGGSKNAAEEAFNPFTFFQSKQFDIEIYQKVSSSTQYDIAPVIRFRDCRFSNLQFSLQKRSPLILNMNFVSRYFDDDTLVARGSGSGQEFS
jgi:hypothetical protein